MDNIYIWMGLSFVLYTLGAYLFLVAATTQELGLKNRSKTVRRILAIFWPILVLWAILEDT